MAPDATVYEVRCPRCHTSFAPETRRCVHCGGPLGDGLLARMRQAAVVEEAAAGQDAVPPHPEELAQADELAARTRGRNVLWIITAVLALGSSLMHNCQ